MRCISHFQGKVHRHTLLIIVASCFHYLYIVVMWRYIALKLLYIDIQQVSDISALKSSIENLHKIQEIYRKFSDIESTESSNNCGLFNGNCGKLGFWRVNVHKIRLFYIKLHMLFYTRAGGRPPGRARLFGQIPGGLPGTSNRT